MNNDPLSDLIKDSKPTRTQRYKVLQIRVPRALFHRFKELLPMAGSQSWFIRHCMERFIRQMSDVPTDAIERAVETIVKDLTGGRNRMGRRE